MRRPLDAILALVLIAWLPFCCCQARSAAAALGRAVTTCESACSDGSCQPADVPGCCASNAPSQAPVGCCHPEPGQPAEEGCCSTCKDRVLPAATTLPDPDRFGQESPAALAMALPSGAGCLLAALEWAVSSEGSPGGAPPPCAPSGRQALAAHGVLVV